ncbi:MAG TPA: oxygen-independent coproporphyrinogen III oxidase, partial [Chlamydiales bacterium]
QQAIREEDLPSNEEKFHIYTEARKLFIDANYTAIGLDHFAKQGDALATAYLEKRLTRNFQGYTVQSADDVLGFGVTAIGFLEGAFFQNAKTIEEYQSRIQKKKLPLFRGLVLNREDHLRRFVIQELMCRFSIDKQLFAEMFRKPFDPHFAAERPEINRLIDEGLINETPHQLKATPVGELFIRLIAAVFDEYNGSKIGFSSSI